ncbi:MAG TPA: citrate synthase [Trebonia sp.]|nr:citrate synthase [Trebonia sp.]
MGELLDARTAAERLGVDVRTLYAYVSRGSLRRVPGTDGRSSRYDSDDLELLAKRSRPRTLPRPAASIDLVIATRVSTVTDGVVRYRGVNLADLVAAREPFERVCDLLWDDGAGDWGADHGDVTPPPDGLPVLYRFATAVAAMPEAPQEPGQEVPDWPGYGRRLIGRLVRCPGGSADDGADDGAAASRLLGDEVATVAARLWPRWSRLAPTPPRVRALNTALVLLAEHELALSTLSVRVAASARAVPSACVLAGLSTLSGALHGGAAAALHELLARRATGQQPDLPPRLVAFGHPVHRHGDPRTSLLLDDVYRFATPVDRALIESTAALAAAPPNVDFALGALSYAARMPAEAATAIFAIARTAGWIAHAAEEYGEPPLRFRGRALGGTQAR